MTDEEAMQALRDAKPTWLGDGKGVKGDPVIYHRATATTSFQKSTVEPARILTIEAKKAEYPSEKLPKGAVPATI
jgi:hypothetical protein